MPVELPSPGVLRGISDETVARELIRAGRATRAELAAFTGLSKPTVADAIRRLEAKGLVRDTGERTSGRGGVGTYYGPGEAAGTALAVTIAPEGIVAEIVDAGGTIRGRSEREVDRPADSRTVRRLLSATVTSAVRAQTGPIRLAVVSAADPIDRITGRLVHLPDSPFLVGDLDPAAVLARFVDGPVLVDNDVNWAARHELALRAGTHPLPDFAYLYLGEGLGAAVVSDSEVRRGHQGLAGEVAHLLTIGVKGNAVPFTRVFDDLGLRQPHSAAIDVPSLLTALSKQHIVDTISAAVAGVIAAFVAITDPSTVVLAGSWGTDDRITTGVRAALEAGARPVTIEQTRDPLNAARFGARAAAVHQIQSFVAAQART